MASPTSREREAFKHVTTVYQCSPIYENVGDGVFVKHTDHVGDGVLVKHTDRVGDGVPDIP